MADFTELPVHDGVGDWHFNRCGRSRAFTWKVSY